jgi:16S rRNA C967 or C1407 C5-methylase (RsmB/RsmF family)/NOL1/NOP2/fmu family ribosome biogenesis protein
MRLLLGEEYPDFAAAYGEPPAAGLRVNLLKLSPEEFLAGSPFRLEPVPWCPEGFLILDSPTQPGKHPYHAAGLYYLQDPSAMAAVELLDPQPGELVLDLSAAPGGKATMIAARLGGLGVLIANEIHPKRVWELAGNLERWGARNAAVLNETPGRLAEHFGAIFDRVLLDAPCSGEGMFRKSEAARREWVPELVRSCAVRQSAILEEAARLVRPGGRLAYSTCTFAPEEDEEVALRFLEAHPEFAPAPAPALPGFAPGRPDWVSPPPDPALAAEAAGALVRLWPHRAACEGHFFASFQRISGEPGKARPWRLGKIPRQARQEWAEFAAQNLAGASEEAGLHLEGAYLYRLPPGLPDLAGLRLTHPGWWLGVLKKDRFEPSHALALGLEAGDALRTAPLTSSAPETAAYLRGEGFPSEGENGWTLVTVDGFPLGWGKRVNGVLKNYYPRGLRWV